MSSSGRSPTETPHDLPLIVMLSCPRLSTMKPPVNGPAVRSFSPLVGGVGHDAELWGVTGLLLVTGVARGRVQELNGFLRGHGAEIGCDALGAPAHGHIECAVLPGIA